MSNSGTSWPPAPRVIPRLVDEKSIPTDGTVTISPCRAEDPVATVTEAYFAKLKDGQYVRIKWAGVEDEVYIIVKATGLNGKTIELNVLDRDATITEAAYGILTPLQDGLNKSGEFTTVVGSKGEGIFKLQMKPSDDKTAIENWRTKIGATSDKKAYLCILVDAHSRNPGLKITYYGKNPSTDNTSAKAAISNYWLDMAGKWFELRRKNPVIIIDPGHGYTSGTTGAVCSIYTYKERGADGKPVADKNNQPVTKVANVIELPQYVVDDPVTWIVSKREDPQRSERFLVWDISSRLKTLLEADGYIVFITRERGPLAGSDNETTRSARIALANDNNADYYVSVHADGVNDYTSTGSHVIKPAAADADCTTFATDILGTYNVVPVDDASPKADVRGLQILSGSNKTKRKALVELGFVTTPKDARALFGNVNTIAQQLHDGLVVNINKSF